jgi:nucleoside-diphosphate kinase
MEQTLILIKPDGVERKLVGTIIKKFENKNFILNKCEIHTPTKSMIEEHYKEHKGKPFFNKLVKFMISGPIMSMVWSGDDVVKTSRNMITLIREEFGGKSEKNIIHASDSQISANYEIDLWFNHMCNLTHSEKKSIVYRQLNDIIEAHIASSNKHETDCGWKSVPVSIDCSMIDQDKREDLINDLSKYILTCEKFYGIACVHNDKVEIVGDRFILDFSYNYHKL